MQVTDGVRKRFELAMARKVIDELPLSETAKAEVASKIEAMVAEMKKPVSEVVGDDVRVSER